MKPTNLHKAYFFDFPVADVYGIGSAALNLIYYGSRRGVFGANTKESVALGQVDAFQITMVPRSEALLSDDYDFSLVYYRRDLARELWDGKERSAHHEVKELTRRVELSDKPSLEPHRMRHFYIKSDRPIYVAQFGCRVPSDDCVPSEYLDDFNTRFEGYLMRCPKGVSLEKELFQLQDLSLVEHRDGSVISGVAPHVLLYARA